MEEVSEGQRTYQVVDGFCANGLHEVTEELDDEDGDEEGGHCDDLLSLRMCAHGFGEHSSLERGEE